MLDAELGIDKDRWIERECIRRKRGRRKLKGKVDKGRRKVGEHLF